jgi:hypothetical protein
MRSPCAETMDAKCSGIVWVRSGGWSRHELADSMTAGKR